MAQRKSHRRALARNVFAGPQRAGIAGERGIDRLAALLSLTSGSLLRRPDDVERTLDHPSNELLWGSPGALLVALWLHAETGEPRWRDVFVRGAETSLARLDTCPSKPVRAWRQEMYGLRLWTLGAGHGVAGNAAVLLRGRAFLRLMGTGIRRPFDGDRGDERVEMRSATKRTESRRAMS